MELDRSTAEQQLTSLLNRALKNVPLVKLDAVDDVVKLFTEAIDLMESNQVLDDDDEAAPVQTSMDGQSKLLALAASTASTATNSSSSSANNSDSENGVDARGQPILVNKAVAGLANAALTVDYSSPSSKTRSLGAKAAASKPAAGGSTGLGLGLKSGGGGGSATGPKAGVLGLGHGGTHKPSSRATTGLNALSSGSPSGASSRAVDSTSPVSPVTPNDEAGENGDGQMVLKNKLLSKVSTGGSREYPSPKLGPRSLSVTPKGSGSPQQNPAAAGLSLPVADTLGRDGVMTAPSANTPTSPADADDEGADADNPDDAEGDLIRTDVKNNVFNRVKQELPVTASPKQIRSSFHLLELATTHGLQTADEPDLTQQPHGSSQAAESANHKSPTLGERPINVLSALPTGLQSNSASSTPKPAYLRRLDSPDTHHGQLLAAKSRLQLLINRGLQVADKVKLDKVPEIKAALERALAKLESSLVQPSLGPQ